MSKKPVPDVFCFWQLAELKYGDFSGKYEFPIIHGTSKIPDNLVSFSKCEKVSDTENSTIHFYEYDEKFVHVLDNKKRLERKLETFRRFQSVILPDYSIYRDMPLAMQIFHTYKSHSIGNYLTRHGIKIIPNVRWGDERTYDFAFDGIEKWAIVSVGVQGGYRDSNSKLYFEKGFMKMLEVLEPETILCYGKLSDELNFEVERRKVNIKTYSTEISKRTGKLDKSQLMLFENI